MSAAAILALGGCSTNGVPDRMLAIGHDPASVRTIAEAKVLYGKREFGKATKRYESAVEQDPKNPAAWLGLAASYDQVGRFDLADKAYARLTELVGDTPQVLNNKGYSYLLRGELDSAKHALAAAHRSAPDDTRIQHNISLLNTKLAAVGKPVLAVSFVE